MKRKILNASDKIAKAIKIGKIGMFIDIIIFIMESIGLIFFNCRKAFESLNRSIIKANRIAPIGEPIHNNNLMDFDNFKLSIGFMFNFDFNYNAVLTRQGTQPGSG